MQRPLQHLKAVHTGQQRQAAAIVPPHEQLARAVHRQDCAAGALRHQVGIVRHTHKTHPRAGRVVVLGICTAVGPAVEVVQIIFHRHSSILVFYLV